MDIRDFDKLTRQDLKQMRIDLGLSKKEVGAETGIHWFNGVYRYEEGFIKPLSTKLKLAIYYTNKIENGIK